LLVDAFDVDLDIGGVARGVAGGDGEDGALLVIADEEDAVWAEGEWAGVLDVGGAGFEGVGEIGGSGYGDAENESCAEREGSFHGPSPCFGCVTK
jgi:hypothetical protein